MIADKLEQISKMSGEVLKNRNMASARNSYNRDRGVSRFSTVEDEKKKALKNITKPLRKRQNIVYFGH